MRLIHCKCGSPFFWPLSFFRVLRRVICFYGIFVDPNLLYPNLYHNLLKPQYHQHRLRLPRSNNSNNLSDSRHLRFQCKRRSHLPQWHQHLLQRHRFYLLRFNKRKRHLLHKTCSNKQQVYSNSNLRLLQHLLRRPRLSQLEVHLVWYLRR